jgi:DNA-binding transcriptional ArsR family regulator
MSTSNANQNKSNKLKINPKSHDIGAVLYCWLLQIPSSQLSERAKILYSRLVKWCGVNGIVYRSIKQLSEEVGMSPKAVERTLKELREVKLIGTYRIEEGGVNHYEFYDHEWMHVELNKNLEYPSYPQPPEVPPLKIEGNPPSKLRVPPLKIEGHKYIKNNKNKKSKNTFSSSKVVDNFSRSKSKLPYATKEERIKNEVKIREREEKALREKAQEIEAAKAFMQIMKCREILGYKNKICYQGICL